MKLIGVNLIPQSEWDKGHSSRKDVDYKLLNKPGWSPAVSTDNTGLTGIPETRVSLETSREHFSLWQCIQREQINIMPQ